MLTSLLSLYVGLQIGAPKWYFVAVTLCLIIRSIEAGIGLSK